MEPKAENNKIRSRIQKNEGKKQNQKKIVFKALNNFLENINYQLY